MTTELSHPSDAMALPRVPRRCFDERDDRRFAMGYPHLHFVIDGHRDEAKPLASIKEPWKRYGRVWPRAVARRYVRALAAVDEATPGMLDPAILAHADRADPLDEAEACALITRQLTSSGRGWNGGIEALVQLLETLVGTAPVLDAVVGALEGVGDDWWSPATEVAHARCNPAAFVLASGGLLLRVPADEAARQRGRLEGLYRAGVERGSPRGEGRLLAGLDCVLHGGEGIRRSLPASDWRYFHWYTWCDDREVLVERMNDNMAAAWAPEPRHLYTVGPALIPEHERHAGKVAPPDIPAYVSHVGKLADPQIVDLLLRFTAKKTGKRPVVDWMRAHADHAKARLEQLASGTAADRPTPTKAAAKKAEAALADAARAMLAEL